MPLPQSSFINIKKRYYFWLLFTKLTHLQIDELLISQSFWERKKLRFFLNGYLKIGKWYKKVLLPLCSLFALGFMVSCFQINHIWSSNFPNRPLLRETQAIYKSEKGSSPTEFTLSPFKYTPPPHISPLNCCVTIGGYSKQINLLWAQKRGRFCGTHVAWSECVLLSNKERTKHGLRG